MIPLVVLLLLAYITEGAAFTAPLYHIAFDGDVTNQGSILELKSELVDKTYPPLYVTGVVGGGPFVQIKNSAGTLDNPNGGPFPYIISMWLKEAEFHPTTKSILFSCINYGGGIEVFREVNETEKLTLCYSSRDHSLEIRCGYFDLPVDGKWHYMYISYYPGDSQHFRIYKDSYFNPREVENQLGDVFNEMHSDIYIGGHPDFGAGNFFIDSFKIFRETPQGGEIVCPYIIGGTWNGQSCEFPKPQAVATYKFEGLSLVNSGNTPGFSMEEVGGSGSTLCTATGQLGQGITFRRNSPFLRLPNAKQLLSYNAAYMFSFWFKFSNETENVQLLNVANETGCIVLKLSTNISVCCSTSCTHLEVPNDEEWHFFVLSVNHTQAEVGVTATGVVRIDADHSTFQIHNAVFGPTVSDVLEIGSELETGWWSIDEFSIYDVLMDYPQQCTVLLGGVYDALCSCCNYNTTPVDGGCEIVTTGSTGATTGIIVTTGTTAEPPATTQSPATSTTSTTTIGAATTTGVTDGEATTGSVIADPNNTDELTSDDTNMMIIIGAAAGGAVVLGLAVVIAVFVGKRRRNNKESPAVDEVPLRKWKTLDNITVGKRLGEGNFGDVFKGNWNGTDVALKLLKSQEHFADFEREASLLESLNHPHVVRYLGIFKDHQQRRYIVTEFMTKGSLLSVVDVERESITTQDLLRMYANASHLCADKKFSAKQAANGMQFLEENKIIHRDIGLRNFLVRAQDNEPYFVKVSDFGLSRAVANDYYKGENVPLPVRWTAPEALKYGKFTHKSDVWSFGIMLWELFSKGTKPYYEMSNQETVEKVMAGYRLSQPEDCPKDMYDLMMKCWEQKAENRPSFKEISEIIDKILQIYVKNDEGDYHTTNQLSGSDYKVSPLNS